MHFLSICEGTLSYSKVLSAQTNLMLQAIPHPETPNRAIVMEGATWTISSTRTMFNVYDLTL
jgi:hypothetical protein